MKHNLLSYQINHSVYRSGVITIQITLCKDRFTVSVINDNLNVLHSFKLLEESCQINDPKLFDKGDTQTSYYMQGLFTIGMPIKGHTCNFVK